MKTRAAPDVQRVIAREPKMSLAAVAVTLVAACGGADRGAPQAQMAPPAYVPYGPSGPAPQWPPPPPRGPIAAQILIDDGDPPGWGLHDPRPFTPVAGNNARTLGEARWNGAVRAAQIWGALLESSVPIHIRVSFNHEPCGAPGLANGGFSRTFAVPGGRPGVAYPPALANAMSGRDLNGSEPEGGIEVLGVFDDKPECLGRPWYYGFDHPNDYWKTGLDYVGLLLHELGHALGFSNQLAQSTGEGTVSAFDAFMFDESLQKFWPAMTPAERASSAKNVHNLTFNGPATNAIAQRYAANTTNGHMRLDAGTPAIAHWEAANTGGRAGMLMSGNGNNDARSDFVDATSCVFQDMGWRLMPPYRCPDVPTRR